MGPRLRAQDWQRAEGVGVASCPQRVLEAVGRRRTAAMALVLLGLFANDLWAERATPAPPPSRVTRSQGRPTKLQEIRERARRRAEARRRATQRDKQEPVQPGVQPEGGLGLDKLTPESVEEGLGARYIRPQVGQRVNLNFTDVELPELVRAISVATGRRFIMSGKIRSLKASLFSPSPVSPGEAYQAFLSVLASNGMTVVPSGRYLKLVESDVTHPVPLCREGQNCGSADRLITRLHRLRFVSADDMSQVLGRFKTGDGDITAYAPTNTMIITDYASNVRRMLRIVQELDVEGVGTHIWIEPIFYASAGEIAGLITQLFPAEEGSPAKATKSSAAKRRSRARRRRRRSKARASKSRDAATVGQSSGERLQLIIPDERTNQLIIVASERTYLQVLELIRALDTPLGEADGEIRVHKLQNADAEELASTLSSLSSGSQKRTSSKRRGRRSKSKSSSAPSAASLFEGEIQVTADKATNSLIIVGSARDYLSLRNVIDQLDVERRQVFVEAVIMEVSLEAQRRFGVAWHTGAEADVQYEGNEEQALGLLGTSFDSGQLNSLILDPSMLQGLALGVRGPEIEGSEDSDILPAGLSIPAFGVVLQALQTSSDVNVLSTPHILAMDNEEAELQVGQNVPVSTSFASGAGALSGLLNRATGGNSGGGLGNVGGMFPQMSIGRQNVGIKLAITPQINQSDQVRLEIQVEVSEVSGESELGPIIGQRMAKTTCVMADQQTVVLGGLVTDNVVNSVAKVPVLGDIPLVGRLFRRTTKRTTKRNLLIFLTPYIVRDATDFRRIFARKMQERREFIDRYTAFEYHEVQPNIDYDRTNGMLEEIRREVSTIEAIEEQERLLAQQDEPEHIPRRPVGEVPPEAVQEFVEEFEDDDYELTIEPASAALNEAPPPPPEAPDEEDE